MDKKNNRTLTIQRTFNAPNKLVWDMWTQPKHIMSWWGPKGMKIQIKEHNLKVDGNWEYVIVMPDGNKFISDGKYSEIIEFEKIISSANFKPMTSNIEMQILFEKFGSKTNFTFSCIHPTEEYCKQQEEMGFHKGWGAAFDRLETHLNNQIKY